MNSDPTNQPGARPEAGETRTYKVAGMTCGHCAASVTEELNEIAGVTGVEVDVPSGLVAVTGAATAAEVAGAVEEAGYAVVAGGDDAATS